MGFVLCFLIKGWWGLVEYERYYNSVMVCSTIYFVEINFCPSSSKLLHTQDPFESQYGIINQKLLELGKFIYSDRSNFQQFLFVSFSGGCFYFGPLSSF